MRYCVKVLCHLKLVNGVIVIDHNEKDGGMYILPQYIASIEKSPNDEKS